MDGYPVPNIPKILSQLFFRIPSRYFTFPNIIFYFIIPFIAATYFWYVVLRKLRIFRRNPAVNLILAFMISFFNVTIIPIFPPWVSVPCLVGLAIILSGYRWTGKRVFLAILIGAFLAWFYPWLMEVFL